MKYGSLLVMGVFSSLSAMLPLSELEIHHPKHDAKKYTPHYRTRLFIKLCDKKVDDRTYLLLSSFSAHYDRNIKLQHVERSSYCSIDVDGHKDDTHDHEQLERMIQDTLKNIGFENIFTSQEMTAQLALKN
jgi:hypothetical protein